MVKSRVEYPSACQGMFLLEEEEEVSERHGSRRESELGSQVRRSRDVDDLHSQELEVVKRSVGYQSLDISSMSKLSTAKEGRKGQSSFGRRRCELRAQWILLRARKIRR